MEPKDYDELVEVFGYLSVLLCHEHEMRVEEILDPSDPTGKREKRGPKIQWKKNLLVQHCLELFEVYRPGEAQQDSKALDGFPAFAHYVYTTASGDKDPKLGNARKLAFGSLDRGLDYHALVTYGAGRRFGPDDASASSADSQANSEPQK